jgi:hypothetical protein
MLVNMHPKTIISASLELGAIRTLAAVSEDMMQNLKLEITDSVRKWTDEFKLSSQLPAIGSCVKPVG